MTDSRVRRLADLLVERCLDVQPRWQVTVRSTPLARPLVEEVARAIGRRGAFALTRYAFGSDRFRVDSEWAREAPLELLSELAPIERYAIDHEDARLTIRAPEDASAGSELPPDRRRAIQKAMEPAMARARSLDVRWAVVQYPTEAGAEQAGMPFPDCEDFVYAACFLDWDLEQERMARIKERFDRADSVRIVGDGTDVTISIAGRSGVVSAGYRNMPDGEVFYSPLEDSAEGVVTYSEFPASYLGSDATNVRLVFREGLIVEATAEEGEDFLLQTLDTDPGARRLGELGLGCNPNIERYTHNVLFDEKIAGTVHLAIGASYTYSGGTNSSAVHWDMVKDLRPGGEIWCDGELVQRDGSWLI